MDTVISMHHVFLTQLIDEDMVILFVDLFSQISSHGDTPQQEENHLRDTEMSMLNLRVPCKHINQLSCLRSLQSNLNTIFLSPFLLFSLVSLVTGLFHCYAFVVNMCKLKQ